MFRPKEETALGRAATATARTTIVPTASVRRVIASARADRGARIVLAAALALAAGLASDLVMPRGPATTIQAFAAIALGLAIGLSGGFLVRSTWVFAPLAILHLAGIELGRLGVVGPTVDAIKFDNTFGILALVLGRGLHALFVLPAMLLGTSIGSTVARGARGMRSNRRRPALGRIAATGILGVAVAGLAFVTALPASTPPILAANGKPIPGSIGELTTVRLGGQEQSILIRAASPDRPVLLYLSGGPGQSDMALARSLSTGWVQDFVVVVWDQRGNGKSYSTLDPVSTATVDQAVSDTIELTDYLRERFGEQKVYLMGESWGTILGVLAVQRAPDRYYAYLGSGQMVNVKETDRRIYADLVAYASHTGDSTLASKLEEMGQPPYRDFPWSNALVLGWYDYIYKPYTPSASAVARSDAAHLDPFGMLGSEYTLIEKANVLRGLLDTFAVMYPQIQNVDFRRDATRLDVPVYILDGKAELEGRRELMLEWYGKLQAPTKELVTFENAAHSVAFEQADEVQKLLNETIVPATYGK